MAGDFNIFMQNDERASCTSKVSLGMLDSNAFVVVARIHDAGYVFKVHPV